MLRPAPVAGWETRGEGVVLQWLLKVEYSEEVTGVARVVGNKDTLRLYHRKDSKRDHTASRLSDESS